MHFFPFYAFSYNDAHASFQKNPLEHCEIGVKEHFTVFIFRFALKKNAFCAVEEAQPCLVQSSTALNVLNLALAPL
jgi:nitrous oxidase accessory protein NosD